MSRGKEVPCACGCGRLAFHSQLKQVTIEQATDITLRQTKTSKRFWVHRLCEEPFTEELGLMVLLEQLVRAYLPTPRSRWWLANFWLNPSRPYQLLRSWWRRVGAARKVMQIQHGIYVRPKKILLGEKAGFEWTKRHATQSAILFGCPRFLQNWLNLQMVRRANKRKAKEDAARPTILYSSGTAETKATA